MQDMNPSYLLAIYLFILLLQFLSAIGNGFILLLFRRSSRLRKNASLRLILVLTGSDLAFAITSIPYSLHYLLFWSPIKLDYDGRLVVALSTPLTVQMKLNLCLSTAIALDRLQAMRWPLYFRRKSQWSFALGATGLGLSLGFLDVILENLWNPLSRIPGCGAVGCFLSRSFRIYWGLSNMSLNVLMLLSTLWVYFEFNKLRHRSVAIAGVEQSQSKAAQKERRNFQQTNRLSVGVLGISLVFLLVPSSLVGCADIVGTDIFSAIGPFYIVGLLLAGVANSLAYILLHIELREAARCVLLRQHANSETTDQTVAAHALNLTITRTRGRSTRHDGSVMPPISTAISQ